MNAAGAPGAAARLIRVLLAEDVKTDAELELRELKRAGIRFEHRLVDTEGGFCRALREFAPDLILSDFSMPLFDGMSALALARELAPDTPFIFVSGTIGEEYAIRALQNGATDYVLKTNLVRLPAAVERGLQDARERAARRETERELSTTRERLTSIFDSLTDVLWSVELPSERLLYISPAAAELYGHAPEKFLANPELWLEVVHPDDRARVAAAWRAQFDARPFDIEYRTVRPDGTLRWIGDRGRMHRDAAGNPQRIDGMARDITESMEQRQRIARLSRIRDFMSSINAALVRLRERDELFAAVCRIAVEAGGFAAALIGMVDAQTGRVDWLNSFGVGDGQQEMEGIRATSRDDTPEGGGIIGRSLRAGRAAVWNDVANEPGVRYRERHVAAGINAIGSFPLMIEGKAVGTLTLRSRETGFFDQDEVKLIEELVSNISFALELIEKQRQLDHLAYYDALTGLPNRALFHDRLTQAIEAARSRTSRLALIVFDIERFTAINDTFGRHVGDRVLQLLGERLRAAASDNGHIARLGGDQFAVLFPAIREAADVARTLAVTMSELFAAPFIIGGRELRLAARAGIAVYPEDANHADTLFRNAEASVKRAKATGERYLFYAPHINAQVAEQVELEGKLRKAIERQEFVLHYQPKVDLATRRIVGAEALIRWNDPDGGLVAPGKFIPILEETGLILAVGRWAIGKAIETHRLWRARGLPAPRIAVNISALQLHEETFVDEVREAIGDMAGGACGLDLEITESLLMRNIDESIRKLRVIQALGVHIALDDFGTGYSSLAYLSRLPLDTVKIDRGFVHGMIDNPHDTSIVTSIISLAQALRLKVVAEGVEHEQQANVLRLLHCDQMQGYLFSPPVPKDQFEALLQAAQT